MKIVQAANSMIANRAKITDVLPGADGDVYFRFGNYKWAIGEDSDGVTLRYFPGDTDIQNLAADIPSPFESHHPSVAYRSSEINTREAYQTFTELKRVVSEQMYNVNLVLDDIIGEMDDGLD